MRSLGSFARPCVVVVALLLCALGVAAGSGFCPTVCTCKWKSGKQSVECNDKGLIAIPEGIDPETQLLDMSNNNLQTLPKETFVRAALFDLQKVYLRNCRIGQIDDRALRGLSNVVDLDLSRNLLTSVPTSIFEDVPNLRNLSLAHNPIQKVDAAAFRHVTALTKLDLSHCQITTIASTAFEGVEYLELLRLNGNKLSELKLKTVDTLSGLHGIELHDNPWYCDCSLRTLKLWLTERKVPYAIEPVCNGGPSRIQNRSFNHLHADDFACKPEMKTKPDNRYIESTAGDNATILCRVESVPKATISWHWNGRQLLNNTSFSPFQRIVIFESGDTEKRSTLTLTNAQEMDSSQFNCIAENQAGTAEANFTLRVVHRLAGFAVFGQNHVASISLALIVLIVTILGVIVYLLYRIRKMPSARKVKHAAAGGAARVGRGDDVIPNGTIHAAGDSKSLTIEPTLDVKRTYATSPSALYAGRDDPQTLPRLAGIAYSTMFEDGGYAGRPDPRGGYQHAQTSNPDLIADTRYQEDVVSQHASSGEYARAGDIFYPSSLWSQNELQKMFRTGGDAVADFRVDTDDKTPIIEEVNFYDGGGHQRDTTATASEHLRHNQLRRPLKECEFPTTSSLAESVGSAATSPSSTATAAYGPPNDAKIMRVWQKGVHVLPPVTALKRVLNRNSPDEGYQEGCGTDV